MAEVVEIEVEEIEAPDVEAQAVQLEPVEDSEANADLESGYADTQTDAQTEPVVSPVVEDAASDPAPAPIYAKITEDEHKRFLASAETIEKVAASYEKRLDTAFGHIGGFQQKLKELQAGTPSGHAIKLTKEDFAEMQAEFPELADMQMKGLERALSRIGVTGAGAGLDEAKASEIFDAKIAGFEKRTLMDTLTDLHEDWETVVGPKDSATPYRAWLATQPQAYQDQLHASRRPSIIAQSITKFKESAATPVRPKAPAPKTSAAADARREQLRDAVTPKGAGGAKVGRTELDDLQEAFDNA